MHFAFGRNDKMTAKTAKSTSKRDDAKLVVFVVYADVVLLDLTGPLQVFSYARDPASDENGYECVVVSVDGGLIETNTVVPIPSAPISSIAGRAIHTLVVVGGDGAVTSMDDSALIRAIKTLAASSMRVCSVCSGALVLAATGLLDGKRAVTHWNDCQMLADRFPNVQVEMDPIYIKDGDLWTSAGITAGIDMSLAIVSEDYGRASALRVARTMVAQMVRSGGQSQFSPALQRQVSDDEGRFAALHTWIDENLAAPLSVDLLAEKAGMSARNFSRLYSKTTGTTPAKELEALRNERAQTLLETTSKSLKEIATACGFKDEDRMRRAFLRTMKVSPSEYRQNFQTSGTI